MVINPFPSKRAPIYADIPGDKWNNWRWQLSNRINTPQEFERIIPLTDSERKEHLKRSPLKERYDETVDRESAII